VYGVSIYLAAELFKLEYFISNGFHQIIIIVVVVVTIITNMSYGDPG
jgi:hypothetical protein